MKIDRSALYGLILGSIVALAVSAHGQTGTDQRPPSAFQEEFHHTYTLNPGGRVSLKNINGWVKINSWNRNEVKIDAVKYAGTRERLDEAKINVDASADSIWIETRYEGAQRPLVITDDDWTHNPATVDYTLTLPTNANLDAIKLINGSLDVENIAGDVRAECINGRLRALGLGGRIDLSTVNGTLEATYTGGKLAVNSATPQNSGPASQDIHLKSVNGNLVLTLASDTNAEVRAKTVSGHISNDFGLPVDDGKYVGHSLAGRFGTGAGRIELKNVNGSIAVHRASDGKTPSAVQNLLEPKHAREASF